MHGNTALSAAADQGDIYIVEILIPNGADVNQVTRNGVTPLTAAAWSQADTRGRGGFADFVQAGRLDIVDLHLRHGAIADKSYDGR